MDRADDTCDLREIRKFCVQIASGMFGEDEERTPELLTGMAADIENYILTGKSLLKTERALADQV